MINPSPERLARHLEPHLPEARLARQWAAIEARAASARPPVRPVWTLPLAGVFGISAAAMILVLSLRPHSPVEAAAEGSSVESAERHVLTLADGSRVTLGQASLVRLTKIRASEVELTLERGAIDL